MFNTIRLNTVSCALMLFACSNAVAGLAAFPGGIGYGMSTPGGRGGEIIRVTNLNDSGQGSLRACAESSGPRICVFEVSGTIPLESYITVTDPNLTVAGQTAPSPGIMLRGSLSIGASNVLIQHLAVRAGDDRSGTKINTRDTLRIASRTPIRNIVIDHCSLSWAIDENLSMYHHWSDVTISNTIISEPLRDSISSSGAHGYAALISTTSKDSRITLVGNLFAHGHNRNPWSDAAEFVFVNNVTYNAGGASIMLTNRYGMSTNNAIVGNVFIDGKDTETKPIRLTGQDAGLGVSAILSGTRLYIADNQSMHSTDDPWSIVYNKSSIGRHILEVLDAPTWPEGLTALETDDDVVLSSVLKNVGSRPAQRNAVDSRVISEVRNGTGQIINCVSDDGSSRCTKNAGGWPNLAKNYRTLALPKNPNDDNDNDGYTDAEEWLHSMAAEVEGQTLSGPSPIDGSAPPKAPQIVNSQ